MTKSILYLSVIVPVLALGACSTSPDLEAYADQDCKTLRAFVDAQDAAASIRGVEIVSNRQLEEVRATSGSPWAGRSLTRDEDELLKERRELRDAYRRKGCVR